MTLNELIYRLKAEDPNRYVRLGFSYAHAHRGDYSQLALCPYVSQSQQVKDLSEIAESAINSVVEGYKGGNYKITEDSEVYLATYGCCGFPIEEMLYLIFSTTKDPAIVSGVFDTQAITEKKLDKYQIAGYRLAMRLLQSDSALDDRESEAVSLFFTKEIIQKVMTDKLFAKSKSEAPVDALVDQRFFENVD